MGIDNVIDSDMVLSGFLKNSMSELREIINQYNITPTTEVNYEWSGFRGGVIQGLSEKRKYVLDIWKYLYLNI